MTKQTAEEKQNGQQNTKQQEFMAGKTGEKPTASPPQPLAHIPQPFIEAGSPEALERSVALAERYFTLLDRIRKAAVKATNYRDWIDQDGEPYLEFKGAAKVANAFGVIITDRERERQDYEDDKGPYYVFIERANARWNERVQPEMGTCSTRDKFFAVRGSGDDRHLLPLSEIDITSVMKKAHTNLLNRAIKGLLGLSFSWEELEEISDGKISRQACAGVTHRKGSQGGKNQTQEGSKMYNEARKLLLDISSGDKDIYAETLAKVTTFKGHNDKQVPGCTTLKGMSEARLAKSMPALRKMHAEWKKATNQPD